MRCSRRDGLHVRSAACHSTRRVTSVRGRTAISTDLTARPPHHGGGDAELRIDWIEARDLRDGLPGSIGLTVLPGKHGVSARYPGVVFRRDLERDLATLRAARVGYLLLLVEDDELAQWGDPDIVERAHTAGIDVARVRVADGGAPPDIATMATMLHGLDRARRRGHVAIACLGGVGRTGTVAACALVRSGMAPTEAIEAVRRIRHPEAVETQRQRDFVHAYADTMGGANQRDRGGPR